MTLAAWVCLGTNGYSSGTILSISNSTNNNPLNRIFTGQPSLSVDCQSRGVNAAQNDSSNFIDGVIGTRHFALFEWVHFTGTIFSAGGTQHYINGIYAGKSPFAVSTFAACDRTTIGVLTRTTDGAFFNGFIAHAAIWNIALAPEEIKTLGQDPQFSPRWMHPESLVGYWPLSTNGTDHSGFSNHMTLANTLVGPDPIVSKPVPFADMLATPVTITFLSGWSRQSNLPVIGGGTF